MLTIPFMAYIIFRYLYIINVTHDAGAPEEVLLSDTDAGCHPPFGIGSDRGVLFIVTQIYICDTMTHASAPGKIILFGEHAVVYGRPALAVPVTQVHADVEVTASRDNQTLIHAPDINLHAELNSLPSDHPIASVIHNLLFSLGISPFPSLEIKITSTIPVASGLGSGAAVTVALIRALSSFLSHPLPNEQINQFAYEIEKLHHGTPSGIDNTVVTYARPVYFIRRLPLSRGRGGWGVRLKFSASALPSPSSSRTLASPRRQKNPWEMSQVVGSG